jgi:O-antigen ligase
MLHTILYALGIVAYNPFLIWIKPNYQLHYARAYIWTHPKLLVFALILLVNLVTILVHLRREDAPRNPGKAWVHLLWLWAVFLVIGTVATVFSPHSWWAFRGHSEMGDGLLYWMMVGVFVLSQAYLVRIRPELLRYQTYGIVIGGVVCAAAIFPQLFDWRLDYTMTSGVRISETGLLSGVHRIQMPVGLYSHRGNAGAILSIAAVLCLYGMARGYSRRWMLAGAYGIISAGLLLTRTRGPILALIAGSLYLLWLNRRNPVRRRALFLYGGSGMGFAVIVYLLLPLAYDLNIRNMPKSESVHSFTSGRDLFWKVASEGIRRRPAFGWGFDGFGISAYQLVDDIFPLDSSVTDTMSPGSRLKRNRFVSLVKDEEGEITTVYTTEAKAHNLLFDTILSVGILGFAAYVALLLFAFRTTARNPHLYGLEVVAVTYLVYTLTWFECAQFTHYAWWALATGVGMAHAKEREVRSEQREVRSEIAT